MSAINLRTDNYDSVLLTSTARHSPWGDDVAPAGDFNGDGFDDFLTGGAVLGSIYGRSGTLVVYLGGSGPPAGNGVRTFGSNHGYDLFSHNFDAAGDINGDGFDDLIVSAPNFYGSAHVIFGGSGERFRITSVNDYYGLGRSVSGAGDVNGDGFDDLIVGLPFGEDRSGALVIFGKAEAFEDVDISTLPADEGFAVAGAARFDGAGTSVASAGDVNGDGFDDIVIGAPGADGGGENAGEAYVIFGKADGFGTVDVADLSASEGFVIQGEEEGHQAGSSVDSAGDVNGDGYDDVIIGAPDKGTGSAYVIFGKPDGFGTIDLAALPAAAGFAIHSDPDAYGMVLSIASAGDVDGDGFDDVIVGSPSARYGAFVIFGKADGFGTIELSDLSANDGLAIDSGFDRDLFGTSVASAGDVNNDGYDDILVGAPDAGAGGLWGGVHLLLGGPRFAVTDFIGTAADDTVAAGLREDRLDGGGGDDSLAGRGGDDTLLGRDGDDLLGGGAGDDLLIGGSGSDTAAYRNANASVTIDLAQSIQNTLGAGTDRLISIENVIGSDQDDTIRGSHSDNRLAGGLRGDVLEGRGGDDLLDGGTGTDTAEYRSALAGVRVSLDVREAQDTVSDGIDTLVDIENLTGSSFDDVLAGSGGANILDGGAGDDRLRGNRGDDRLIGGVGNDTATYAGLPGSAGVNASLNNGATGGGGTDTFSGIENLTGSAFADRLTGNGGANILDGGDGDDVIDGRAGPDRMIGRGGDDDYFVRDASGAVVEAAAAGTDKVFAHIENYILDPNVENLVLGNAIVAGSGNNLANSLVGNSMANLLSGRGGSDVIDGGVGADDMRGGAGDDVYYVDWVDDRTVETADGGRDTVRSRTDHRLAANVENLVLIGSAVSGTGNELANGIAGNRLANDLDGGAGADRMVGGAGDDLYHVDRAQDRVIESEGQGTDTVRSSVDHALARHVENLVLAGAAVSGTGNILANDITGNALANILDGRDGDDRMRGGGGDDTYFIDDAGDRAVEASGGGDDTVRSSVGHGLANHVENLVLSGTGAINGAGNELANRITGAGGDNRLSGAGGADDLAGMAGDDRLAGGEGGDRLTGGAGYDALSGEAGADEMEGNSGNDTLSGGSGNDLLHGGADRDRLTGGTGSDRFFFDTPIVPVDADLIADFDIADDTIMLDRAVFDAIGSDRVLAASAFREGNAAADANDRIIYNMANGNLYYDADGAGGADQLLFAKVTAGTALTNADFVAYSEAAEALRTNFEAI